MFTISAIAAMAGTVGQAAITIDTLMETPIVQFEDAVSAQGEAIARLGTGLVTVRIEGEPAVRWETEDAAIIVRRKMKAGHWKIRVHCLAPDTGTDSLWVLLNGEQQPTALTTPTKAAGWADFGFLIEEEGEHEIKLILREDPGMLMTAFELGRIRIVPDQPPIRPELADQRPRFYLTSEMVQRLPELVKERQEYYKPAGPPSATLRDYEAAQGDMAWGRSLPRHALAYRLNPDPEYLRLLKAQVLNLASFPHWGNPKWGRFSDVDLDAEYAMEGLALCYDWLYDQWTDEERALIRNRIALACERIFTASLGGRTGGGHNYQQNHFWFPHYALALGAAAVYGEVPQAEDWLAWSWDRMERILVTFADDGGFHEHAGYWDFSMTPLFQWIDLYEQVTGRKIPAGEQALAKTAYYRFHCVFPGGNRSAALGDCSKTIGPGNLTNYMWLAKRYNDPIVRGIVDLIRSKPGDSPWHLLYAEPGAKSKDPRQELPTAAYFDDIETVFARTDWTPNATMVAFICRPMGGKFWWNIAHRYGLNAVGHNHPDANHFILFGRGEVLCVDPGYTYTKLTRNHNTVLVDGQGQYGDGEMWPRMNDGWGEIEEFRVEDGGTYVRGNATRQYRPELGLTRFVRHLELRNRDEVLIRDELAAERPRTFTWLLHYEGELREIEPDAWEMIKGTARLEIRLSCKAEHMARIGTIEPNYEHPQRSVRPKEGATLGELAIDIGPTTEAEVRVQLTVGDA
ncbi:MAG: DUF4962 domain-containing protein [Candidatus Zipacnadales bacterium]